MTIIIITVILYAVSAFLTVMLYLKATNTRLVVAVSAAQFLLASLGCLGVTLCICAYSFAATAADDRQGIASALSDLSLFLKVEGLYIAFGLIILFISFALSRSRLAAVLRISLGAAWAIMAVIWGVIAAQISIVGDPELMTYITLSGIGASAILALPSAMELHKLSADMKDPELMAQRNAVVAAHRAKREERKKISQMRRSLKGRR